MRILVDQSGYDLMNVGDIAMLQSCVARLRTQWPGAEIMVIAHDAGRLEACCPGTIAIGRTFADLPFLRPIPQRLRLALEQAWRIAGPYFAARLGRWGRAPADPRTAIRAARSADLVVASGGAYVTDTWWWHGAGVLSLLALAQRLGKPTAMLGQGIGPISQRALRSQARPVLRRLAVLGLREERTGGGIARSFGVRPHSVTVTGDEALELIGSVSATEGRALGVNVRVSGYAGVDTATAATVGQIVLGVASALKAPIVGLPVSRYPADADLAAISALLGRRRSEATVVLHDVASAETLVSAAAGCRAIVTGSYHAAVFGLALGVPSVCLTKSSYYDAKFGGLRDLFPGTCFVISLDAPELPRRLEAMIQQAWHLPAPVRAAARETAERLRSSGRAAYEQLRAAVEDSALVTSDR